jgi:hypothetical protein
MEKPPARPGKVCCQYPSGEGTFHTYVIVVFVHPGGSDREGDPHPATDRPPIIHRIPADRSISLGSFLFIRILLFEK